jgi:hypothetical protein
MERYYIPYKGSQPAAININGHSVLIVSSDRDALVEHLSEQGVDRFKVFDSAETPEEQVVQLAWLSNAVKGEVVVAPDFLSLKELVESLEGQLPWIQ